MIFEKKISIDGVAVIVATLGLCTWLVTLKGQANQTEKATIENTAELKDVHSILVQMEVKNENLDRLQKNYDDHEARLRVLEKDADFLRISR